jgi:hypothetical protein
MTTEQAPITASAFHAKGKPNVPVLKSKKICLHLLGYKEKNGHRIDIKNSWERNTEERK